MPARSGATANRTNPTAADRGTGFGDEPALEIQAGFQSAAADNQSIGIERVHHLIEEQPERVGLHAEDLAAEGIAALRHPADELGRLDYV